LKISLLGAESTGKSELAAQLAQHFQAQGKSVQAIPEYLRTWCDANNRTPRQEEQDAIALEQMRQIDSASACDVLIADTTSLTVAAYSDVFFNDASLYNMALAHQRGFDATLLMGLDLPWVADGIQRDGVYMREPVDAALRAALTQGGINFQVVYGLGAARLQSALRCLHTNTNSDGGLKGSLENSELRPQRNRYWTCERCSDPVCEHRLFVDLLHKT
jgi:nicotinamide riboside kinase